jgi:toxin-antitoxin system, toxin component, Txe/YoeB family
MEKKWTERAWSDYLYWQEYDRKILRKINKLLEDIDRNGERAGIGHPEPLKGDKAELWSRHIDKEHRLVYRIREGILEIMVCRTHYGDR